MFPGQGGREERKGGMEGGREGGRQDRMKEGKLIACAVSVYQKNHFGKDCTNDHDLWSVRRPHKERSLVAKL